MVIKIFATDYSECWFVINTPESVRVGKMARSFVLVIVRKLVYFGTYLVPALKGLNVAICVVAVSTLELVRMGTYQGGSCFYPIELVICKQLCPHICAVNFKLA
ncbi:MAG TPA: hypothetical protein VL947_09335 [Cytophagales bacterium]|nr:hypothetical protein [Cytophagales bacterium]